MGMAAELIAIGPYSDAIADFLDYGRERYKLTPEGTMISCRLFGIYEGSTVSREFAHMLGITDPWDFSQHKLNPAKADVSKLEKFGQVYEDYERDVEAFKVLHKNGFEFHFRPQG